MKNLLRRPHHATVVAYVALFVSLGLGTAYAANTIGSPDVINNSLKSEDIQDGTLGAQDLAADSVTNAEMAPNAVRTGDILDGTIGPTDIALNGVTSARVRDGSLTKADFAAGQLPTILTAYVGANGNLIYGQGATAAEKDSTGSYNVTFNRALGGCVALAAVGANFNDSGWGATTTTNDASVTISGSSVSVYITDDAGTARGNAFMVTVFCP